jgi:hypothetical protein
VFEPVQTGLRDRPAAVKNTMDRAAGKAARRGRPRLLGLWWLESDTAVS